MKKTAIKISVILAAAAIALLNAAIIGFVAFALLSKGIHAFTWPDKTGYEDGWTYYYSDGKDWCIAASWEWDGDPDHMTVTVPETLGGKTVTRLSTAQEGYGLFCVGMPESIQGTNEDDMGFENFGECDAAETDDYEIYNFTIVLNPNIKEVYCEDCYGGRILDEETGGEDVEYAVVYTFTMDGESDYFDIVDGKPVEK